MSVRHANRKPCTAAIKQEKSTTLLTIAAVAPVLGAEKDTDVVEEPLGERFPDPVGSSGDDIV